jgi:hypothetical protein
MSFGLPLLHFSVGSGIAGTSIALFGYPYLLGVGSKPSAVILAALHMHFTCDSAVPTLALYSSKTSRQLYRSDSNIYKLYSCNQLSHLTLYYG